MVYEWEWSAAPSSGASTLGRALTAWHRGGRLGCKLDTLTLGREQVTGRALDRLNLWIEADGAWRASLLNEVVAERVLRDVLHRERLWPIGNAGGGRWAARATLEEILRDGGNSVEPVARLHV